MKLRSGVRVDAVNGKIAVNPPEKKTIADINASSPLLRLPPEIKNQIYEHTCGGETLHIHDQGNKLGHYLCCARVSEAQAQKAFDETSPFPWASSEIYDRHRGCTERSPKLDLGILRACRQIYHEAKFIPYSSNTFSFFVADTFQRFMSSMVRSRSPLNINLSLRNAQLTIVIFHDDMENKWNKLLRQMRTRLPCIQRLHIELELSVCACSTEKYRYSNKSQGREKLVHEIYGLCTLPFKEVVVLFDDEDWGGGAGGAALNYRWTRQQQQAYSRDVRKALLGL